MKKSLLIALLFVLMVGIKLEAQPSVTDTLAYLKTEIEAKKSLYIGQPLSTLLNDLLIQPQTVTSGSSYKNKNLEPGTLFIFVPYPSVARKEHFIDIEWATPLQLSESQNLQKDNNWLFTSAVRNYYANKIIKNISVR